MERCEIKSLFERDPSREFGRVVMVDRHEDEIVAPEVEEYVVTDQIRRAFNDIIDHYIESRKSLVPGVCAWISGFFGSGKSHFLKMLGYLLTNRRVRLSSGAEVRVADYFREKHGIRGLHVAAMKLRTKALFINMLTYDRIKEKDLPRFIYRIFLRSLGLSEIFWVAEVELMLKSKMIWKKFVEFVEREEKMAWEDVRMIESRVRSVLVRGLMAADPKAYPELSLAEQAVKDAEKEFTIDPERLALKLAEQAKLLHPKDGRVVLLLDEVGLYIGRDPERLTQLNALAERVDKVGAGRVWIFATAQEALDEVIPKIEARRPELEWIRDRFRIKVMLTPENISTVVNKRLLQKNTEAYCFLELKDLYEKHEGSLKMSVLLKEPARDPHGLFTQLNFEDFAQTYPLMPYHTRLMIDVFGTLRARGRVSPELTGRERAVLGVARATMLDLLSTDIGALVTFDMVYDAIDEELKVVQSEYQALIQDEVAKLGKVEGIEVVSVAKALFLLQQVGEQIPCSMANVAAVLYSEIGVDQKEHERKVQRCLETLTGSGWIVSEEGRYRFLSSVERTFEQEVQRQTRDIRERERLDLTVKTAESILRPFRKYTYEKLRTFDVNISADDEELSRRGHLKLKIYTPHWASRHEDAVSEIHTKSLAEEDVTFWIAKGNERFDEKVERVIAVHKALHERERTSPSPQELRELDRYRKETELMREDELPALLVSSLRSGLVVHRGEKIQLDGKAELGEVINKQMSNLVGELFTEFSCAAVKVNEPDIRSILTWTGGALPPVYGKLGLINEHDNISISGPVADRIRREIEKRVDLGAETERTGHALAEHFGSPPYGWDVNVVLLTLATLFRNGTVEVESNGRIYRSAEETGSHDAFTSIRTFNRARFHLGARVTIDQRKQASSRISEIFAKDAGITLEQISDTVTSAVSETIKAIQELRTVEGYHQLPFTSRLNELEQALQRIHRQPSRPHKILTFLEERTFQPVQRNMPLLNNLKEFCESGNMTLLLRIKKFTAGPLEDLAAADPSKDIQSRKTNIERTVTNEDLLKKWKELYDDFVYLRDKHDKVYEKIHEELQNKSEKAVEEIRAWGASKGLPEKEIEKSLTPLSEILCVGGPRAEYDEKDIMCANCRRGLTRIRDHLEVIGHRCDQIKSDLIRKLKDLKELPFAQKLSRRKQVATQEELEQVLRETSEFGQFWISKAKKVNIKISAEAEQSKE